MPQKGQNKTFANKRTLNPPATTGSRRRSNLTNGSQQQDPKRRLGAFVGAGEHSRNTVRSTQKN